MSTTQAPHETERAGSAQEFGLSHEAEPRSEMTERKPTLEEIAREAYAIYLANGSQDGHDLEHWLEAERRIVALHQPTIPQQGDAVVQHANGDSRQKPARLLADRRRTPRPSVPKYLPV